MRINSINSLKQKISMIFFLALEKEFDKVQHPLMIKAQQIKTRTGLL